MALSGKPNPVREAIKALAFMGRYLMGLHKYTGLSLLCTGLKGTPPARPASLCGLQYNAQLYCCSSLEDVARPLVTSSVFAANHSLRTLWERVAATMKKPR
jgi:hypothetical protein